MKVIVREKVDADLDDIFQWIARDNPRAAAAMVARITPSANPPLGSVPICSGLY
jgi:plasmid stabilization system protein ParE